MDGKLSAVTVLSVTDSRLEYGVDYLVPWLQRADAIWRLSHAGAPPDGIDIIAHGEGANLVRAYIQSEAYPDETQEGSALPAINNFVLIGAPQTGVPQVVGDSQDDLTIDPPAALKYGIGALVLGGLLFGGAEILTGGAALPAAIGTATFVVGSKLVTGADILELVDDISNIGDAFDLVKELLGGEEDALPTDPVIEDNARTYRVLDLTAPAGQGDSLTPTFQWEYILPPDESVEVVKVYVSTHPAGQGLFPSDLPIEIANEFEDESLPLNANGDRDINPNRIFTCASYVATCAFNDTFTEIQLPPELELTAGQTYHWGVEITTTNERRGPVKLNRTFKTPFVTTTDRTRFAGVTLITHGFQLPYVDKTVPEDYKEFARHIAAASNGFLFQYDKKQGNWLPDPVHNKNATTLRALNEGRPLILLSDWAIESSISDSGFSEAAADALFAGLVSLDQGIRNSSPSTLQHPIFESPIHLIGFSRGTPVTAEIAQRIGKFFPNIPEDMHVTTLDPHDFRQDTLDVPLAGTLDALTTVSFLVGAPLLPLASVFAKARVLATLSGNTEVQYGDFRDPEIFKWSTVKFHDNYWQNQVQLDCDPAPLPDFPLVPDELACGFTPNGRSLSQLTPIPTLDPNTNQLTPADADDRWVLNEFSPQAPSSADLDLQLNCRAGFTQDDGLGGPHMRAKSWYIGTAKLDLDQFPSSDKIDEEWDDPRSDVEDAVVRTRAGLGKYEGVDQGWYLAGESDPSSPCNRPPDFVDESTAVREGIGAGWYYSVLGGGREDRPTDRPGASRSVEYDNSKYPSRFQGIDPAVPTVFNGHFDVSIRPKFGRFPLPAIPDFAECDNIACLGPSWKEIPGWSFHGGSGGLLQGDNIVDLVELSLLEEVFGQLLVRTIEDAEFRAQQQITDGIKRRVPQRLAGAVGGLVKLPLEILDLLNIEPTTYAENQFLEYLDLRERGLLNQVYEISDLGFSDLTHNRMLFPAAATALEFKYWVTEEGSFDFLKVDFTEGFNPNGTPRVVECSVVITDCSIGLQSVGEDLTDDGFVVKRVPIPQELRGKVGTFTVKAVSDTSGGGFNASVLLDEFRLVTDDIIITDDSGAPDDEIIFFDTSDGQADPFEPGSEPNFISPSSRTLPDGAPIGDVDDPGFRVEPTTVTRQRLTIRNDLPAGQEVHVVGLEVSANQWLGFLGITPDNPSPILVNNGQIHPNIIGAVPIVANGQSLDLFFTPRLNDSFLPNLQADGALLNAIVELTFEIAPGTPQFRTVTRSFELIHLVDASDSDPDDRSVKFADTIPGHSRELVFLNQTEAEAELQAGSDPAFVIENDLAGDLIRFRFQTDAATAPRPRTANWFLNLGNSVINSVPSPKVEALVVPRAVVDVPLYQARALLDTILTCKGLIENGTQCDFDEQAQIPQYQAFYNLLPGQTEITDADFNQFQLGVFSALNHVYNDNTHSTFIDAGDVTFNFVTEPPAGGVHTPPAPTNGCMEPGVFFTSVLPHNEQTPNANCHAKRSSTWGLATQWFASADFRDKLLKLVDGQLRHTRLSNSSIRYVLDQAIGYQREAPRVRIFMDTIAQTVADQTVGIGSLFDLGRFTGLNLAHEFGHNFGLQDQYRYHANNPFLLLLNSPPLEGPNFMTNQHSPVMTRSQAKSLALSFDNPQRQDALLGWTGTQADVRAGLVSLINFIKELDLLEMSNTNSRNAVRRPTQRGTAASPPAQSLTESALPASPVAGSPSTTFLDPATIPHLRNNFLLDLNAGRSAVTGALDPSVFDGVGGVTAIYSGVLSTTETFTTRLGQDFARSILSLRGHEATPAENEQFWLEGTSRTSAGDGRVPLSSAALPLLGLENVQLVAAASGDVSHAGLPSNPDVQRSILTALGRDASTAVIAPSTARTDMSRVVALAHVGAEAMIIDAAGNQLGFSTATGAINGIPGSVYRGDTVGIGYIFERIQGPLTYHIIGTGGPYFVQAAAIGNKVSGGIQLHGTLAAGETLTQTFEIEEIFELPGIPTLIELINPSLGGNFTITIRPNEVNVTGNVTVAADGAALFPNTKTPELDGVVTATGVQIDVSLATGGVKLTAGTATIDIAGVVTGSANPIPDPDDPDPNAPPNPMLPGLELNLAASRIDPTAVIGALRGLNLTIPALGDLPTNFVQVNEVEIRRDGFGLDVTAIAPNPNTTVTLGGDTPIATLTNPEVRLILDVGLVGGLSVDGTVEISADSAELFPGPGPGPASITIEDDDPTNLPRGVTGTIDLADGSFSLTARKLILGGLLEVETTGVTLTHDPDAAPTDDLLRIAQATATIPSLTFNGKTPTVSLTNFGAKQNGDLFLESALLNLPPGYINAIRLGGLIPLEINSLALAFPQPFDDFSEFTLTATGQLLMGDLNSRLDSLFAPVDAAPVAVVYIGDPPDATCEPGATVREIRPGGPDNGAFTFAIKVLEGGVIVPKDLGPITLGIEGLPVGTSTSLNMLLTLGGYEDGDLRGDILGCVKVVSSGEGFAAGLKIDIASADPPDDPTGAVLLNLTGTVDVSANVQGVVGIDGAEITFSMELLATPTTNFPFVTLSDPTPQNPIARLDSIAIDQLEIKVGCDTPPAGQAPDRNTCIMILTAEGVSIDFTASPDEQQFLLDQVEVTFPRYPFLPATTVSGVEVYRNRIEIDSADITVNGHIGANPRILDLENFQVHVRNFGVNLQTGAIQNIAGAPSAASIEVSGGATLLPEKGPNGIASIVNLDGRWESGGDLVFDSATLVLPLLGDQGVQLSVTGLAFRGDGQVELQTATLQANVTLPLFGLLPFELSSVTIGSPAPADPVSLTEFDLTIAGRFNFDREPNGPLAALLPFTPLVCIGEPVAGIGGHTTGLSLDNILNDCNGQVNLPISIDLDSPAGPIGLSNFEPIVLGFDDLHLGPLTVGGAIVLDNLNEPTLAIGGKLKILGATDVTGNDAQDGIAISGAEFTLLGSFTPGDADTDAVLQAEIDGDLKVRFAIDGLIELRGVNFNFDFTLTNRADPTNSFADLELDASLNEVGFDSLKIELGPVIITAPRGATFNFTDDDTIPLATIPVLTVSMEHVLPGMSGTLSNLEINHDGTVDLNGLEILLSPPDDVFDFDWLPIRLDEFGVRFGKDAEGDEEEVCGGDFIDDDPESPHFDRICVIVSGGIEAKDEGKFHWPFTATVDRLELDIAKLIAGEFPIKDLNGFSIGIDPGDLLEGTGFNVRGEIGFSSATICGQTVNYVRLLGDFSFQDLGAGVELAISDLGPLFARVNAPLGIPLDPAGAIILTGVSGVLQFGLSQLRDVADPLELVRDPTFFNALELDGADFKTRAEAALTRLSCEANDPTEPLPPEDRKFTWEDSFTAGLRGNLTTVAMPGILTADVDVGLNVVFDDPNDNVEVENAGLRLFAAGNASIWGMPLGRAGALLSFSDILAPQFNLAFEAPAADNPLGFLFPAHATLGVRLVTDGVVEAPIRAMRAFVDSLEASFLDELTNLAGRLQADHSQPIAQLILDHDPADGRVSRLPRRLVDVDGNGQATRAENCAVASPPEDCQVIDVGLFLSRVRELLPDSVADIQGLSNQDLARGAQVVSALLEELLKINSAQFADAIQDALRAAITAFDTTFNPSFVLKGDIQPTIFGIPLGEPTDSVELIVDKDQISFALSTDLIETFIKRPIDLMSNRVGGVLVDLFTLGAQLRATVGFTLNLPDESLDVLHDILTDPNLDLAAAAADLIDIINPFDNWEILVKGELSVLGFNVGSVSGIVFPRQLNEDGERDPSGFFNEHVVNIDQNPSSASEPNPDLSLAVPGKIPVSRTRQYEAMQDFGGLLLTGQLFIPKIIKDPFALLAPPECIDDDTPPTPCFWTPPPLDANVLTSYPQYVTNIIDTLLSVDELARIQLYVPSPAALFDLDTFFPPDGSDPSYLDYDSEHDTAAAGELRFPRSASGTFVPPTPFNPQAVPPQTLPAGAILFADLNGNRQYDLRIDVLIDPAANRAWAEVGTPNFVFGGQDVAIDLDSASAALMPAIPGVSYFILGDAFVDVGNGLYNGAQGFDDVNGNGQLDETETVFDAFEGFVDANGNGRYDRGTLDTLIEVSAQTRPGGGLFIDTNANGKFDFIDKNANETFDGATDVPVDLPVTNPFLHNDGLPTGELFIDANGNGRYDGPEPFSDEEPTRNGIRDLTENFRDLNGNGEYDPCEPFADRNGDGLPQTGEFEDDDSNGQFTCTTERFLDLGNSRFDTPATKRRITSKVDQLAGQALDAFLDRVAGIFDAAYFEGYADLKLLGIDIGEAFISASSQGLTVETKFPLLNIGSTFTVGFNNLNVGGLITSVFDNPLVAEFLPNNLQGAINEIIRASAGINIPFPVASYTVGASLVANLPNAAAAEVSVDQIGDLLADLLGVDADSAGAFLEHVLAPSEDPLGARFEFAVYTPGFDLDAPHPLRDTGALVDSLLGPEEELDEISVPLFDDVKRYGGIRIDTQLNIPHFVEDARFFFEAELLATSLTSIVLPDFKALAKVDKLAIPNLAAGPQNDLFRASMLAFLSKDGDRIDLILDGGISLLNNLLVVDASLVGAIDARLAGCNENPGGACHPGAFGEMALTARFGDEPTLADDQFSIVGEFIAQFNTTDTSQTLPHGTIPDRTGRIHVEGHVEVFGFTVLNNAVLDVQLTTAPGEVAFQAIASGELDLGPFGSVDLENAFIRLDSSGIAVDVDLDIEEPLRLRALGVTLLEIDGNFRLQLNTSENQITYETCNINGANCVEHSLDPMILNVEVFGDDDRDDDTDPDGATATLLGVVKGELSLSMRLSRDEITAAGAVSLKFPADKPDDEADVFLGGEGSLRITNDFFEAHATGSGQLFGVEGSVAVTLDRFKCLRSDVNGVDIQHIGLDDDSDVECLPHLYVDSLRVNERDSGQKTHNFGVFLTEPYIPGLFDQKPFIVEYDVVRPAEDLARGIDPVEFSDDPNPDVVTLSSGEFTFSKDTGAYPFPLEEFISFKVLGDTFPENDETFQIVITGIRDVDDDEGNAGAAIGSDKIIIPSSFDEGTVTVLDDDTRLPGPVSVTVRRTGFNRGRTTPGTPSRSESQDTMIVRATGLLPGDSTRVEVRRNFGGTVQTRTVTLTEDNPFQTVSFDDCVFDRNGLATYSAEILVPAEDATITLRPLVDVPATQIINDDSERPCGSLVFYNFETPSFLPASQEFRFTPEPTFVAEAPAVVTETTFDDRAQFSATPLTHSVLLDFAPGVFKEDPGQPRRNDSLAAASDQWSTTPRPKFFEFEIELSNTVFDPLNPGNPPSPLRYNVTAIDFWDQVVSGGPRKWELRSDQDNFRSVLASGSTHPGTLGHNIQVPIVGNLGCLAGDTKFRLIGLDGGSKDWAVDNLALIGHFDFAGSCASPPNTPNVTVPVPEDSGEVVVDLDDHVIDLDGDLVTIVPPVLRFTPPANVCNFSTSQSYSATDSRGQTSFGTVIFTVSCVNDPPVANDFTVIRNPGVASVPVNLSANVSDVDGNVAAVVPIGSGARGFLVSNGVGGFNYVRFPNTPDIDDVVPYQVIDSQGLIDIGFVTIHVNQRPVATDQTITVSQCGFVEIDLRNFVSDETDDDLLIYAITLPQGGLAGDLNSLAIPQLFYEPRETLGMDTFKYKVTDEDGRTSIERTVTLDVTVDCGPIEPQDPPELDLPIDGQAPAVDGGTVFLDANRNGVRDFLDLDRDGRKDVGEPDEPTTRTAADGRFSLPVPRIFDRAGDGAIDSGDGVLVVMGGTLTTTLRPLTIPLMAPPEAGVVTPATTVVVGVMEGQGTTVPSPSPALENSPTLGPQAGLTLAQAHARVQQAFGLEAINLLDTNHITTTLAGNPLSPILAATIAQLSDLVAQATALLDGASGQPVTALAGAIYDSIAALLAEPDATLNLSDTASLQSTISASAEAVGAALPGSTIAAAAVTIAAGNQRIGEIPISSDLGYLISLYRVEAVAQGSTSSDLALLGAGQLAPDDLVAAHTGSALDAALASAPRGNIVTPALSIGDVSVFEGDAGSTRLTFRVSTPVSSVLPISVDFETADGSALDGLGDYVRVAGTLTFAPGETEKFITVDAAANNTFEQHKTFFVVLSDVQGAVVADAKATGTILNDDEPVFTAGDIDKDSSVALSDLASLQNDLGKITDPGDPADLNDDGRVTRGDVAELLRNYGRSFDTDEPADIDRGGSIGLSDLASVQEIWGAIVEPGHVADLNGDLRIDRPDIVAILRNFGDSVAPSPAPSAAQQSPAAVVARAAQVGPSPASDRLRANAARTRIDRAQDALAASATSTAVRLRATRQNVSAKAIDEIFGNG